LEESDQPFLSKKLRETPVGERLSERVNFSLKKERGPRGRGRQKYFRLHLEKEKRNLGGKSRSKKRGSLRLTEEGPKRNF